MSAEGGYHKLAFAFEPPICAIFHSSVHAIANTLNPLAVVNLDIEGDYAVLIAKPQPDGTTRIVSVLPSATKAVINALMQHIAKHKVAATQADAQNAAEIDSFKQPAREADPLADALAA